MWSVTTRRFLSDKRQYAAGDPLSELQLNIGVGHSAYQRGPFGVIRLSAGA
jgi:hypothetical protein